MENKSTHWPSFGELLKNSRKLRRLTQRHLADKMGVHYNTIYRWEQGDFHIWYTQRRFAMTDLVLDVLTVAPLAVATIHLIVVLGEARK